MTRTEIVFLVGLFITYNVLVWSLSLTIGSPDYFQALMVGLFVAWIAGTFLTAKTANYIEWLVENMREEGDI